jgi:hypothetical protein
MSKARRASCVPLRVKRGASEEVDRAVPCPPTDGLAAVSSMLNVQQQKLLKMIPKIGDMILTSPDGAADPPSRHLNSITSRIEQPVVRQSDGLVPQRARCYSRSGYAAQIVRLQRV